MLSNFGLDPLAAAIYLSMVIGIGEEMVDDMAGYYHTTMIMMALLTFAFEVLVYLLSPVTNTRDA